MDINDKDKNDIKLRNHRLTMIKKANDLAVQEIEKSGKCFDFPINKDK